MNGLSPQWKFFRILCIIQMVLVAFEMMLSVSGIFFRTKLIYPITETLAYAVMFFFVYMGLSMLNYNYPDTPLTAKQKRNFNWLFLVNFLLIAYLFAQVIVEWRRVIPWISLIEGRTIDYISVLTTLLLTMLVFVLHVIFLGGMYTLRRVIYQNTMDGWYRQFDEEKK